METRPIQDYFEKFNDDSLSFLYHGFMSDEFTTKIISIIEKNIRKNDEPAIVRNKVAYLIAESFQNIFRHGESLNKGKSRFSNPGFFSIRVSGDTYIISTANLISKGNKEKVEKKLLQINSLDKDQLKLLFKEVLGSLDLSDKGGAGLGLIDMARKTGNNLEYDFEKLNEDLFLFYFQIRFNSKTIDNDNTTNYPISITKGFHEVMDQNNTYLIYKGDFSHENVLTLLKITERNLQINPFENKSLKTLIYLILTELLQNISKHSYALENKKTGIFLIGKDFNKYVLSTGNFIENTNIPALKENLNNLNSRNSDELRELFINRIKNGEFDSHGNAGIGFIKIAKECHEIKYSLSPVNDVYSFLTININI